MRELRRATQGEGSEQENQQKPRDNAPGESKKNPSQKDGGSRVDPPQQSVGPENNPANNEFNDVLETSLGFQDRPAHSGGSATALRERSTVWTA